MSFRARARFSASLIALGLSWSMVASASDGEASNQGKRIAAGVDWALMPDDDLRISDFERFHGIDPETLPVTALEQGGMVYGRDSNAASVMATADMPPLPAVQYEPSPGVLYLAMGGITVRPGEPNSALNRTPLVKQETTFPAYGSESQQSAVLQKLQSYYQPFDLVLSKNRPPDWMPFTMAVIGGSAQLSGQPGGVCGVANVACDGLKRNHVSLTFPQSCSGVAETAAQETAHNWGLEHTDNTADLMYPYNNGGSKSFVNSCMNISHATGSGITQCGHIHRVYCNDNPERQNSHAELLAAFGPRNPDNTPPVITELFPADGSTFTTEESFNVSARVTENSNFLAAKWTWLEGLPDDLDSWTRCTNGVCNDNYGLGVDFDPDAIAWDFVRLTQPPAGNYEFQFEVMDAYGNYDARIIRVKVVPPGSSGDSGGGDSDSGSGSDGDDGGEGGSDFDDDGSGGTLDGDDSGGGHDRSGDDGCRVAGMPSPTRGGTGLLALLTLAALVRRRV